MPPTPSSTPAAGTCTLYTQAHTDRESLTHEKKEFNKETEWTALVRSRQASWLAPAYPWPFPFILLSFYFPTIVPPQITSILPCPHLWFLPRTSHKKSCAMPRCSSPASHDESPTAGQGPPQSVRCPRDSPGRSQGRMFFRFPHLCGWR